MQRILLLDDEQIERMILETILAEAGFNVYASSISTTPLLAAGNRIFDVAILDLSGIARHVSDILVWCDALAGTAILAMTDNGTIEHALRPDATTIAVDYIKKPFSKEEFLSAVSRTIQHARELRENPTLKKQEAIRIPPQS